MLTHAQAVGLHDDCPSDQAKNNVNTLAQLNGCILDGVLWPNSFLFLFFICIYFLLFCFTQNIASTLLITLSFPNNIKVQWREDFVKFSIINQRKHFSYTY